MTKMCNVFKTCIIFKMQMNINFDGDDRHNKEIQIATGNSPHVRITNYYCLALSGDNVMSV